MWTPVNHDDDIEISRHWDEVTCKRCLKQKESIEFHLKKQEETICKSMGDMADWHMEECRYLQYDQDNNAYDMRNHYDVVRWLALPNKWRIEY